MQQAAMQAMQKFHLAQQEQLAKGQPVEQPGGGAVVPVKGPDVAGSVNIPQEQPA